MAESRRTKGMHKRGSSDLRIAQLISELKNRKYGSSSDYFESIAKASEVLADVASAVALLEAAHLANHEFQSSSGSKTIVVHPTENPELDYRNIQRAIDNALPGDRVLLKSGIFRSSGVLWIWKGIVIEGENGAVIEGTTHNRGRVLADPALNGGFIITGRHEVEIRNVAFRHLHFGVSSRDFGGILLENNSFEDIYHSVHISSDSDRSLLIARKNKVIISSLNNLSSRCRLNFFDESHIFGIYCNGNIKLILEGNRLEIKEMTGNQPFHVVGAFFCGKGVAAIRNNFFKGWHAPISVYNVRHPVIYDNEIHGMCEDSEYKPIAIFVRDCIEPTISENKITSRGLASGSIGIAAAGTKKGSIINNKISLGSYSNSAIFVYCCNGLLIGQNEITKGPSCPIGLFGSQSEEIKNNMVFGNDIEGASDIKIAYATDNTILGLRGEKNSDPENALLGYGIEVIEGGPMWMDREECMRHQKIFEHLHRKQWPSTPLRYLSGEQI